MRDLFFFKRCKMKLILLLLTIVLPTYAFAATDMQTAQLSNQSKQEGTDGFYLVQDKTWSENNCVKYSGSNKIDPGKTTSFDMKKDCTWGGVGFKVFKVANNELVGYLSYSIRDGETSMEIKTTCKEGQCNFYGIIPMIKNSSN